MLPCRYNILWKYKIMIMGRPINSFPCAGKRSRLCNVGGILLSWHQDWEIRCIWCCHCFFAKFLHWSGFMRTVGRIFRWRKGRTWPEQMFKDGHDKKHGYQDSCGNKTKRNGIHGCSKAFPWSFLTRSCLRWAWVWTCIYVPWLWSLRTKVTHSCNELDFLFLFSSEGKQVGREYR